jgi:hypothetical protein
MTVFLDTFYGRRARQMLKHVVDYLLSPSAFVLFGENSSSDFLQILL